MSDSPLTRRLFFPSSCISRLPRPAAETFHLDDKRALVSPEFYASLFEGKTGL